MAGSISAKIEQGLGARIVRSKPLSGGDIADVSLLTLEDGRQVVAKRPRMDQPDTTAVEKMMLKHLSIKSPLLVPEVLFQAKGILVISHIPHQGTKDGEVVAIDVASHIAALHAVRPKSAKSFYGFEKDTFIGPLPQQNKPSDNWVQFFRDHRLLAMAASSARTGRLPSASMKRIETLAERLNEFLPTAPKSSLLHGDLWAGNMLVDGDKVAGFIDPAISYGHNEMDLAFIDLMGGLDPIFFAAYSKHTPIDSAFFENRKTIYQLWPLLVHVRLFGGGYVAQIDRALAELGF